MTESVLCYNFIIQNKEATQEQVASLTLSVKFISTLVYLSTQGTHRKLIAYLKSNRLHGFR